LIHACWGKNASLIARNRGQTGTRLIVAQWPCLSTIGGNEYSKLIAKTTASAIRHFEIQAWIANIAHIHRWENEFVNATSRIAREIIDKDGFCIRVGRIGLYPLISEIVQHEELVLFGFKPFKKEETAYLGSTWDYSHVVCYLMRIRPLGIGYCKCGRINSRLGIGDHRIYCIGSCGCSAWKFPSVIGHSAIIGIVHIGDRFASTGQGFFCKEQGIWNTRRWSKVIDTSLRQIVGRADVSTWSWKHGIHGIFLSERKHIHAAAVGIVHIVLNLIWKVRIVVRAAV